MSKRKVLVTGQISNAERKPASLLGKNFSILPATMMVEGAYYPHVENFSEPQSLFFSGKQLRQSVMSWNGRPVAVNHPKGSETCNSPANYEKQWIGYVFNSRYDATSKSLKADLWIDDERGTSINDLVAAGKCLDVSIGAFGDIEQCKNNEPYDFTMSNIVGDHLAILPDTCGACSWDDGCGIRAEDANVEWDKVAVFARYVASVRNTARTPSYEGLESTSWGSVTKSLEAYVKGYYKQKGIEQPDGMDVKDLPPTVKKWVASKTLLGDASADNSRDLIFFPVVNPMTNKLNEGALKAVLGGRGSQADISDAARTSAQNKAKMLLEKFEDKSNMKSELNERGEKVSTCEEKKVISPLQEAPVESPKKENLVETKVKAEAEFNTEQWLGQAPPEFRNYLVNSMKSYDRMRDKHITKILNCKKATFCEKDLRNVSDMSLLESISGLVDAISVEEKQASTRNVVPMQQNYQLKAASGNAQPERQLDYAPFKDIDYVQAQKERLENERSRYGRR